MSREEYAFCHRFRVRYAEVDPQSVVFNSRYLEYADVLLGEYWRSHGFQLTGAGTMELHIRRAVVDYLKPIFFDEEIDGLVRVSKLGTSSVTTLIELHSADTDDLRATIELVNVHVDLSTSRPKPLPTSFRAAFGAR